MPASAPATSNGSAIGATWISANLSTRTISASLRSRTPSYTSSKSPLFKLEKVKAPVLIFHGSADRNVPPAQSWTYFRALQYYDKPVKFVVFPGEPHGPRKLTHQMRKVEEEIAWFDKYFFKTTKNEDEAVKAGSPLDIRLRTKEWFRVTATLRRLIFSVKGKSVVIPEVVKRNDLEIGRFEVTRAQFAAFDRNYKFEPQQKTTQPTASILTRPPPMPRGSAQITGQTWRIPERERSFQSSSDKKEGENTLDYWAGLCAESGRPGQNKKEISRLEGSWPLL